jgi:hypothetical protein
MALAPAQITTTSVWARLFKIGGNIHCLFETAMHPADSAGYENLDTGKMSGVHCSGDSGGTELLAGNDTGQVAHGKPLATPEGNWENFQFLGGETDFDCRPLVAMVAGTAPALRTMDSTFCAIWMFCG